ncbi:MBL fold metallo-hydrolase [Ferrimonas kyonanensis]|uniref:MBL fold metallo-hydrolase n=1 Tax=Ferrimonas kyonanensis TaxID=364763 RepID=UPI0004897EBF|nr:MBL fold metallo-hydrolase [Ferrimonas kyonanensis]
MLRRQFLKRAVTLGGAAVATTLPFSGHADPARLAQVQRSAKQVAGFAPDLDTLRRLASVMLGPLPTELNVVRFAESHRKASLVLEGGDPQRKINLARTAHQLVYPQGSVILDSGMDEATHDYFGSSSDPFYMEKYQRLQQAMRQANLIVLSHYHADHVGGVVTSPYFEEIADKVWLSSDTREFMVTTPHKASIEICRERTERFIAIDFDNYYPVAPGIVAIKAPGHTPDSKMFYIRLQNGQEYLHSSDTGWTLENITSGKMKNAPWVKEDREALKAQFAWLNTLMKEQPNLIMINSHDTPSYLALRERGLLGEFRI